MTGETLPSGEAFVPVAEVVKAVGLRGEFKLYPLLDWHAALLETNFLQWRDGGPFRPVACRPDRSCWVVGTEECGTREQAEAQVGRQIGFVRAQYMDADFPRPPQGLPFRFLGREVTTVAGEVVGRVREVRRCATQMLLVIAGAGGGELLIPAVAPILRAQEGLTGPLVIDPPPGLIDGMALTDGP